MFQRCSVTNAVINISFLILLDSSVLKRVLKLLHVLRDNNYYNNYNYYYYYYYTTTDCRFLLYFGHDGLKTLLYLKIFYELTFLL